MASPSYEDLILRRDGQRWPCAGQPPAWAELRGHMIRPAEWFHNEQSGFAHEPKTKSGSFPATGLLLSKHASSRSYMDAEIVITSINGQQSLDTPETHRRREAMQQAIDKKRLIGIIIEQGAFQVTTQTPKPLFPGDGLPKNINCIVLGWFLPVMMWPEKVAEQVNGNPKAGAQWMVKLQKERLEERSWWRNPQHPPPPTQRRRNFRIQAPRQTCSHCQQISPRIFTEHFVCLNNDCHAGSWRIHGNIIAEDEALTYSPQFLQERYRVRQASDLVEGPSPHPHFFADFHEWWQNTYQPTSSQPLTMDNYQDRMALLLTSFCCPNCKMMNFRDDWVHWRCRNIECKQYSPGNTAFSLRGAPPILDAAQAIALCPRTRSGRSRSTPDQSLPTAVSALQSTPDEDLSYLQTVPSFQSIRRTPAFDIYSFKLHDECFIEYFKPRPGANQTAGGADYLYRRLQELANEGTLKLRRRSILANGRPKITNHFSQNFGVPYLMDVTVDTTPFEQSPTEIRGATTMADNWTHPFRGKDDPRFNEMYIAAYWCGQKMGYHNDGEIDLGNHIGTLSLGGRGTFSVVINERFHLGYSSRNLGPDGSRHWIKDDPVIPRCHQESERAALKQRLVAGEITQGQWLTEFSQLMAGAKRDAKTKREQLALPATHGCYILMHGKHMQRYFEHSMNVEGPLRFALTFRHVGKRNYEDQQKITRNDRRATADETFTPER